MAEGSRSPLEPSESAPLGSKYARDALKWAPDGFQFAPYNSQFAPGSSQYYALRSLIAPEFSQCDRDGSQYARCSSQLATLLTPGASLLPKSKRSSGELALELKTDEGELP
jgi:hypothetical protein